MGKNIKFSDFAFTDSCKFDLQADLTPQSFTSPGWPIRYRSKLMCQWTLRAAPQGKVRLNFTNFETEECCDVVKVNIELLYCN